MRPGSPLHYAPLMRRDRAKRCIERTGLHATNDTFSLTFQSANPASISGKRCSYGAYCLDLPLVGY